MTHPNLLNLSDDEIVEEVRAHARSIAESDKPREYVSRVLRIRDLLEELFGKPIDHSDLK
jgi:hypothetical protein